MSDKQLSAFILLLVTAFIFYLYNVKTNKGSSTLLADVVNQITGNTSLHAGTDVPTNAGTKGANTITLSPTNYSLIPSATDGLVQPNLLNSVPAQAFSGTLTPMTLNGAVGDF